MSVSEECIIIAKFLVPVQRLQGDFSWFICGQPWKVFLHGKYHHPYNEGNHGYSGPTFIYRALRVPEVGE